MATSNRAKSTLPYLQRLLEDEYVQEQLRDAANGIRSAYRRARRERAEAPDDKKLYRDLRRAATSIRNLAVVFRKPEPPPPKRRGRKLLIIVLAGTGAALLTRFGRKHQGAGTSSSIDDAATDGAASDAGGATHPRTVATGS